MIQLPNLLPLDTTPEKDKIVKLDVNGTTNKYKFIDVKFATQHAQIWQIELHNQQTIYALKTFNEKYITQIRQHPHNYNLATQWGKIKKLVSGIGAFDWVVDSYCPTATNPEDRDYNMSIIMPWLNGYSIGAMHVLRKFGTSFSCNFQQISSIFINSLVDLEKKGIAHIDICSDNVLIDISNPDYPKVHIIDIDEMYHQCLDSPPFVYISSLNRVNCQGQMGYRFPGILNPNHGWSANTDRYSAAILLSQILAFNDPNVQANWNDEKGYFDDTSRGIAIIGSADMNRRDVLLKALDSLGYKNLQALITKTLQSDCYTKIDDLPTLNDLANALNNDLSKLTSRTAQSTSNPTISINPPQISTPHSNQLPSANNQHIPYKTFATSRAPVLFVFIVDVSQSMYENKGIDNAMALCNQLLGQLRRNAQSTIIVPRYHIALFCYHSYAINVFDTLEKDNPGTLGIIGIPPTSRTLDEYPSIVTISQLENFTLSQHIIDKIRPPKISAKYVQTDYSEAFDTVHKFLIQHIQKYADSHPPYVYHITDGNMTDLNTADVEKRAQNIRDLSTNYGNVLLSHVLIDRSIQSSKEQNQHIIELLKQISSPMPAQYADDSSRSLEFPCLFYYPCVDELKRFIVKTSMTGSSRS